MFIFEFFYVISQSETNKIFLKAFRCIVFNRQTYRYYRVSHICRSASSTPNICITSRRSARFMAEVSGRLFMLVNPVP